MQKRFLSICLILSLSLGSLFADASGPFRLSLAKDLSIGIPAAVLDITAASIDIAQGKSIGPFSFGNDDRDEDYLSGIRNDKDSVNSFDRYFMHGYNRVYDLTGQAATGIALLIPAACFATDSSEWGTWMAMYAETLALAWGTKEIIKNAVGRERPYTYYDDAPDGDLKNGDWEQSFPSGHTTLAFAAATFATYTFCKYFPDSGWRWAVGLGSFAAATAAACFRVESGKHFATDVLAGAAIGSAIGFLVPWVHTFGVDDDGDDSSPVSTAVLPGLIQASITF